MLSSPNKIDKPRDRDGTILGSHKSSSVLQKQKEEQANVISVQAEQANVIISVQAEQFRCLKCGEEEVRKWQGAEKSPHSRQDC